MDAYQTRPEWLCILGSWGVVAATPWVFTERASRALTFSAISVTINGAVTEKQFIGQERKMYQPTTNPPYTTAEILTGLLVALISMALVGGTVWMLCRLG
jgi:hypothetical protein